MIKKLLLIATLFMATSIWSEPSDFVAKELISKEVTYMSMGLHKCNKDFEGRKGDRPQVRCNYNWDDNRLEFTQATQQSLTKDDYEEALSQCKKLINPILYNLVAEEGAYMFLNMYLQGFLPQGYSYKDTDRGEKLEEFVKRSLVVLYFLNGWSSVDTWQCDWKYGDKEPSLKWIPKE